jgi:hypothetical protein
MSATKSGTVLQSLELDSSIIDSMPEPVLSELIGFIEYDSRLSPRKDEQGGGRGQEAASFGLVSWPDR